MRQQPVESQRPVNAPQHSSPSQLMGPQHRCTDRVTLRGQLHSHRQEGAVEGLQNPKENVDAQAPSQSWGVEAHRRRSRILGITWCRRKGCSARSRDRSKFGFAISGPLVKKSSPNPTPLNDTREDAALKWGRGQWGRRDPPTGTPRPRATHIAKAATHTPNSGRVATHAAA